MTDYDFIHGSKVIIQCQAQINMISWKGDGQNEYTKYLILIKKDPSFFTNWCKPRNVVKCMISAPPDETLDEEVLEKVGTNIDDVLIERKRALVWTKTIGKTHHVSLSGHGKQMLILKTPTFCARDMGITFNPDGYIISK